MHARYIGVILALLCGSLFGACKESTLADLQEARRLLVIGETDDSIALYEKVLEAHPNEVEAHVKLAGIHLNRVDLDLAKPHIDSAVELAPNDAGTNYVRGRYLLTQRLWVQAGQSLEIASREDIFNPDVQFWLGVALARLGKEKLFCEELSRADLLDPKERPMPIGKQRTDAPIGRGGVRIQAPIQRSQR